MLAKWNRLWTFWLDDLGASSNILKLSKGGAYYMVEQYDKSIDMLDDLIKNAGLNDSDLFEATTESLCLLYLGKDYVGKEGPVVPLIS